MIHELHHAAESIAPELRAVSDFIYRNPETALKEYRAAERLCGLLGEWGYDVQHPLLPEMPTSFRTSWSSGGENLPEIAFFAEYDALPGFGHACGHNLIAVTGLAAFHLSVQYMKKHHIPGNLVLIGSPAEENYSGKVQLEEAHVFDGLDAAIISHPADVTSMDTGALSVARYRVTFHGRASHAGAAPEQGINALDAMLNLFQTISTWRQQLPEASRIHGIITNGGTAVNIIPDLTCAEFYIRAQDVSTEEFMKSRFRTLAEAAAMTTGCTCEVESLGYQTKACLVNQTLSRTYAEYMQELGEEMICCTGKEGRIGTDFGNVSQLMPGFNAKFGICRKKGVALHTEEFREAAGTDYGFAQALKCSAGMASVAIRCFTDGKFLRTALEEFRNNKRPY